MKDRLILYMIAILMTLGVIFSSFTASNIISNQKIIIENQNLLKEKLSNAFDKEETTYVVGRY